MREYRFTTLDVFASAPFGGNPLAVFMNAEGMSDDEMQSGTRCIGARRTTLLSRTATGSTNIRTIGFPCTHVRTGETTLESRMFAPLSGILESRSFASSLPYFLVSAASSRRYPSAMARSFNESAPAARSLSEF